MRLWGSADTLVRVIEERERRMVIALCRSGHKAQHGRSGGRQAGGTRVWAVVWASESTVGYRATNVA